jgi:tripartite-type tricarboxylate transporter receptor subunit TctC
MKHFSALLLAFFCTMNASWATAQEWPSKPIRIIVPFPPGGTTDAAIRPVADRLSQRLGVPVIVENKAGAAGNIGYEFVAHSAPDGYTLVVGNDSLGLQPHLGTRLGYDPLKDLVGVVQLSSQPLVIAAHASQPYETLRQLIDYAKARGSALPYGTSGVGNSQNLAGEWFSRVAGIPMLHVPYKGGGQAITDLVGGQVPLAVLGIAPVMPHHKSGKVRILAVTTKHRSPLLPQVPTVAESGFPDFYLDQWSALFAPAATPQSVVERVNREVNSIIQETAIRSRYESLSMTARGGKPEDLDRLLRDDYARYGKLAKELGIRAE